MKKLLQITGFVLLFCPLILTGCNAEKIAEGFAQIANSKGINSRLGAENRQRLRKVGKSAVNIGKVIEKAREDFTPAEKYYIGRSVAATILGHYRMLKNNSANHYLNLIGQSLAKVKITDAGDTYAGYSFLFLDSKEINAFATPGGHIMITKGLLQCCQGEDELAAVLAHEIAHVQWKHGLRAINANRKKEVLFTIFAEGRKYGPGGIGSDKLSRLFNNVIQDVGNSLLVGKYSRALELKADESALFILQTTGYNPAAFINVLKQMKQRFKPSSKGFARSHPAPSYRIDKVEKLLQGKTHQTSIPARQARFKQNLSSLLN